MNGDADERRIEPELSPATATPPRARRRGGGRLFVLALALLIGAGGYLAWRQYTAQRTAQLGRLDALEATTNRLNGDVHDLNRQLSSDIADRLTSLEQAMAEVEAAQRRALPDPWDVENLLRIAGDRLQLARDAATALAALQRADDRLRALGDPIYAETRRRLATEITALQAVPEPDVSGIAYELTALDERLEALSAERTRTAPAGTSAQEPGETGWRDWLQHVWRSIRSLVFIHRTAGPPLLAPEQRGYLLQNLRLKIEAARSALLARDGADYRASLQGAGDWIGRYYDTDDPAVADVSDRLAKLGRIDIEPKLPDVSGSLDALHAAIEQRRGAAAAGANMGRTPPRPTAPP